MDNIGLKGIIDKINGFKLQIIINRALYSDNIINKEDYEIVENSLLDKIDILSNEMEMDI